MSLKNHLLNCAKDSSSEVEKFLNGATLESITTVDVMKASIKAAQLASELNRLAGAMEQSNSTIKE